MGEPEEDFNTLVFEKKLSQLKDTQESIQSLSAWCLKQRVNHKKIVSSWLNVLKRVKVEQRLTLFYLANDVIQYSKRKNYEFVGSWGCYLQKATPLVRDEKVRPKILRIFKIWEERSVYDDEFLSDLTGLLSAGGSKKTADDDPLDFQPQQLVNKIRQCSSLEADTDLCLKVIHNSPLELSDAGALLISLKERRNKVDVEKDINEGIACVEKYTQALQKEIVARETLLAILKSSNQYYSTQRGEVKVVALAYKTFGHRVRAQKRKLDELVPKLPSAAPSPPQRDEDVPSPGPDEDFELPGIGEAEDEVLYNIDKTFSTSLSADGSLYNLGISSFLSGDHPMKLFTDDKLKEINETNGKKIEVIENYRPMDKQEININDLLKNLIPINNNNNIANSDNISVTSGTISQKSQDTLPGLDLLNPDKPGTTAPPSSFYGAINSNIYEDHEPYIPEARSNLWNNASWSIPASVTPTMVPPVSIMHQPPRAFPEVPKLFCETPESPPPATVPLTVPPLVPDTRLFTQDLPSADVDHRGLLPPPPPPPMLSSLGQLEDVDHRMLPSLHPPPTLPVRHSTPIKDVDHRNLISLTHQAMPQPRELSQGVDQDYRVGPSIAPSDIVESVDMDLSEDEDHQMQQMYANSGASFNHDDNRRHTYNQNNKVLVGGHNQNTSQNSNLISINSAPIEQKPYKKIEKLHLETLSIPPPVIPESLTAPPSLPLMNIFDSTPDNEFLNPYTNPPFPQNQTFQNNKQHLNNFQLQDKSKSEDNQGAFDRIEETMRMMEQVKSNDSEFDGENRTRFFDSSASREIVRNPSPPSTECAEDQWTEGENNWSNAPQMPNRNYMSNQTNPRFQRNWNPPGMRPNFRPPGFIPQQFWPRNLQRPPHRPWMGHRPQRFW